MLTITDKRIIETIDKLTKEAGYPPSHQEISLETGNRRQYVSYRVAILRENGYVEYDNKFKRTLRLAKLGVEYIIAKEKSKAYRGK